MSDTQDGPTSPAEPASATFTWPTKSMGARVDIDDKDAVWAILDEELINELRRRE